MCARSGKTPMRVDTIPTNKGTPPTDWLHLIALYELRMYASPPFSFAFDMNHILRVTDANRGHAS